MDRSNRARYRRNSNIGPRRTYRSKQSQSETHRADDCRPEIAACAQCEKWTEGRDPQDMEQWTNSAITAGGVGCDETK